MLQDKNQALVRIIENQLSKKAGFAHVFPVPYVEPWNLMTSGNPGNCLQVACGHSHSLALVQNEESLKENVYAWGLGSSGQLGIPKEQLQDGVAARRCGRGREDV